MTLTDLQEWRRRETDPRIRASLKEILFAATYGRPIKLNQFMDEVTILVQGLAKE